MSVKGQPQSLLRGMLGALALLCLLAGPARAAAPADLVVVVTPGAPVGVGQTARFAATVSNRGGTAATQPVDVQLSPRLGAGATPTATGSGWTCDATGHCRTDADIAADAAAPPLTVTVAATESLSYGAAGVGATVSSTDDTVTGDNSAYANVPIVLGQGPDLAAATRPTGPAKAGQGAVFVVSVRNVGTSAASGRVEVQLASSGQVTGAITASGSGWTCPTNAGRCTTDADTAPGASLPDLTVHAPTASGLHANSSASAGLSTRVDSPDNTFSANDTGFTSTPIVAAADIDLVAAVRSTTVPAAGQPATFKVALRNLGGAAATGTIEMRLTTSGGAATGAYTASGSGWICPAGADRCTTSADVAGGAALPELTVAVATVPGLASGTQSVRISATAISPDDAEPDNNTVSATAPVHASGPVDLAAAVDGTGPVLAGQPASFAVRVRNLGGGAATGRIEVALSGWYNVDNSALAGSGTGWTCPATSNRCFTDADVAPGATLPVLTVQTPTTATGALRSQLNATVSSPDDAIAQNNSVYAAEPLTTSALGDISGHPDVVATLSSVGPWRMGENGSFVATVANVGAGPAGDVTVDLDAPYPGATASGSGWACTTSLVCMHPGPVAAGASLPPITVSGPTPLHDALDTRTTSVQVDADGDAFPANDAMSAAVATGGPLVDVIATLSDLDASRLGQSGSFTTTLTNAGTSAAGDVTVRLSSPFSGATASGSGWACTSTLVCTHGGPMAAGASLPPVTTSFAIPQSDVLDTRTVAADVDAADDALTGNDNVSADIAVGGPLVDVVAMLGTVGPWRLGEPGSFTTTVSNVGSQPSGDVTVRINAPFTGSAAHPSASGQGWSCDSTLTCSHTGPVGGGMSLAPITVAFATPQRDSVETRSAQVSVDADGDAVTRNDSVSATGATGGPAVDLVTTLLADGPWRQGDTTSFRTRVANAGTASASGKVTVAISAPTGARADGDGWRCTSEPRCVHDGPVDGGHVLPDIVTSVPLKADDPAMTVALSATLVDAADDASVNNSNSLSVPVSRTGGPGQLRVAIARSRTGDISSTSPEDVTLSVRNAGTNTVAGPVALKLTPSTSMVVESASGLGWTCDASLNCQRSLPLEAGASATLTARVRLSAQSTTGESLLAVARAGSLPTASAVLRAPNRAASGADLIGATRALAPTPAGQPATFETKIRNVGTDAATDRVEVRLNVSGATSGTTDAAGDGWSCPDGAERCVTDADVPAGATLPVLRISTPTPAGRSGSSTTTLSTTIESDSDHNTDNNASSAQSPIVGSSGIDLAARIQPTGPAIAGASAQFQALVRNLGGNTATHRVELAYTISGQSPQTGITGSGDGWTCPPGSGKCITDADLAPGGAAPALTLNVPTTPRLQGSPAAVRISANVDSDEEDLPQNDSSSASASIVAAGGVDLALSVAGDAPAIAGDDASFSVRVRNLGGQAATDRVAVRLNASGPVMSNVPTGSGPGWSCPSGSGICFTDADLAPGAVLPTLTVHATSSGDLLVWSGSAVGLSATLSSSQDILDDDDTGQASTPVKARGGVDLVPSLSGADPSTVDGRSRFVAVVRNSGTQTATARVELRLTASYTATADVGLSGSGWSCPAGSGRCVTDSDIAPGATLAPVTVTTTAMLDGYLPTAYATVAGDDDGVTYNNSVSAAQAPARLGRLADLVPSVHVQPRRHGESSSAAIVVRNAGSSSYVGSVSAHLDLPDATATPSGSGWSCTKTPTSTSATCTRPGPVAAGAIVPELAVSMPSMDADAFTTRSLGVTVDDTAYTDDNGALADIANGGVLADLVATITPPDAIRPDESSTVTTIVRNVGGATSSGSIRVRLDGLESGAVSEGSGWSCAGQPVVCEHAGPLAAAVALPALTTHRAASHAANYEVRTLQATVEGGESYTRNDTTSATTSRGGPRIDVTPTITSNSPWRAGEPATFTTVVTNGGTEAATGKVTVQLTAPYSGTTADGDGWACTSTLICEHDGPVGPGLSLPPLVASFTTPARDRFETQNVYATVSSADDLYPANDSTSSTVSVGGPLVDLVATLSTLGPWSVGEDATYTAHVVNTGTQAATGAVTLHLSTPFSGAEATGSGWSCTTTLACEHDGPVAAGASLPDLNISFPVPTNAGLSSRAASIDVDNADDRFAANDSVSLSTGLGAPVVGRRAALFDVEADADEVALGADTQVTARFLEGIDPEGATLRVRLPQGLSLSGAALSGLSDQTVTPDGTGILVTWHVHDAGTPAVGRFAVRAASAATTGTRTITTELSSAYTAEPQSDDVALPIVAPTISGVAPTTLGRAADQTVEVAGTKLSDRYRWELRDGAQHVAASSSGGDADGRTLMFDTSTLADGSHPQLVALADDHVVATAGPSLTIDAPSYVDPEVEVVGPTRVRINTPAFYYVSVHNRSNATIHEVPIVVSVPQGVELQPDQDGGREIEAAAIEKLADLSTPADVRLTPAEAADIIAVLPAAPEVVTDPDTNRSTTMSVVPSIPAGGTARVRVTTIPHQVSPGAVVATVPVNRTTFASGNVSNATRAATVYAATGNVPKGLTAQDCVGIEEACAYASAYQKNLDDTRTFAANHLCMSFSTITFGFLGGNCSLSPTGGLKTLLGKKFPTFGFLKSVYGVWGMFKDLMGLGDKVEKRMNDVQFGVASVDPNDKLSPVGSGPEHYLSGDEPIPYIIRFENLPSASAAAQKVQITDTLPDQLDPSTARVIGAEIGGSTVSLASGATAGSLRKSDGSAVLDAATGRKVLVHAEVNTSTGVVQVALQGPPALDDPFAPTPFADFLPPDDSGGRGQGSITVEARPKSGQHTGTKIQNMASIVFDPHAGGPTIDTPKTLNTLDRDAPTASFGTMPAAAELPFTLPLTVGDVGSGVQKMVLKVVLDGKAQPDLELDPTAGHWTFAGDPGSYEFTAEIVDGVGRSSSVKSSAITLHAPAAPGGGGPPSGSGGPTGGDGGPQDGGGTPQGGGGQSSGGPGTSGRTSSDQGNGGVSGAGGDGTKPQPVRVTVALDKATLRTLRKGKLPVKLTTSGPVTSCAIAIQASAAQQRALHVARSAPLGSVTVRTPRLNGGIAVPFARPVLARLKKARKVALWVTATCQSPGGRVKATASARTIR